MNKNLFEFICSILFFVVMFLEYKKKPMKDQLHETRSKVPWWFFLSFGIVSIFSIFYIANAKGQDVFGDILFSFQIFLCIVYILYLVMYAIEKYRRRA